MSLPLDLSRRTFLIAASATTVTALTPAAWGQKSPSGGGVASSEELPTRDATLKFYADGKRKEFRGNTVICHLPQQCKMRDETVALHDALAHSPLLSKLAMLPSESLHMTVFSGANDKGRIVWPADLAPDASIEDCNRNVGERMNAFHLNCELPLRVRVDQQRTIDNGRACTLRMVPSDDAENSKLRTLRDRLSEVYRFRAKDHDQYEFHITIAYQMQRFSASERSAYRSILTTHLPRIVAASPILELGMPEYCTFRDMFQFDIQKLLAT